MTLRVLLIDDHEMVREGLAVMLEGWCEVVGSVGTAADGVVAAAREQPDIVLLDVRLPDRSGLEIIGELRRVAPAASTVLVTTFENAEWARLALEAGARGYLVKDADRLDVRRSLESVARGGVALDPRIAAELLPDRVASLTRREREVLALIGLGLSNKEIAARCGLSTHTVKDYVSSVLRKLHARCRADAVRQGVAAGYLTVDPEP